MSHNQRVKIGLTKKGVTIRRSVPSSTCQSLVVLVLLLLFLSTRSEARPLLYVTNSTSNTVSVVDAGTLSVIREIPVGREPFGLAFSPDGRRAFVANAQSSEVSVIDATRHRLIQNIGVPSELPVWVAAAPDGTYVYVTNEHSNDVTVIASASYRVVGRIPVGKGPAGIAVSPDSRYAYVANEGSNDVSLIDLQREVVVTTIPVGSVPQGLAMSPDGVWVYVANFGSNSVSVIAAARNEVDAEIDVGDGPVGMAVSPDGRLVYVGNFKAGSLSIVDTALRREVATVPTGAETFGVAVSQNGSQVYAVSGKEQQVVVVDARSRVVRQKAALGRGPFKLAVAPEEPSAFRLRHLWMILFGVSLVVLVLVCLQNREPSKASLRWCLVAIFVLSLGLRFTGLGWGIPVYDAETAKEAPELRVSFHPDEDNFLWNLTRVRPEKLDFAVNDFHWGTLQYHLITVALLMAQLLEFVSTPWRESFIGFHPVEFARIFVTGRAVSAFLGSCSIFLAFGIGKRLYGTQAGLVSALVLALLPLHVVKAHDLTADTTLVFFLLLGFWRLLISFEHPSTWNQVIAGLASGLAVAAKYSALFFLPAVAIGHCLGLGGTRVKKSWFYVGVVLGFLLGEPYALIHSSQFWESVNPYLQFGHLPEGAVPGILALLGLQLKNLATFGLGVPLTLVLLVGLYRFLRAMNVPRQPPRHAAFAPFFKGESVARQTVLFLAIVFFVISVFVLRQPMLRYALPVAMLLVFPAANSLCEMSRSSIGRWLAMAALVLTGGLTLLQVKILTQPHPVNQAFDWVERHLPRGTSIQKGWPELPPLNPAKFQITNFFDQPRMADFRQYFVDGGGKPRFPDYVMLDNLPTLEVPATFVDQLGQNYDLVAELRQPPRLSAFELYEWDPPHDWKYSHPEIRIYRKKQ
jgi:YVTN family beta-propeller protein